jgi:hypothetical protein
LGLDLYIQKIILQIRNETLFFKKRSETERYFFWNRNEINIFQKRNGTKRKKKRFLTPDLDTCTFQVNVF